MCAVGGHWSSHICVRLDLFPGYGVRLVDTTEKAGELTGITREGGTLGRRAAGGPLGCTSGAPGGPIASGYLRSVILRDSVKPPAWSLYRYVPLARLRASNSANCRPAFL